MNAPNLFFLRHEQRDPAVGNRDLDGVISQDQLKVIALN